MNIMSVGKREYWVTAKGERLKISEMTGEHIKNCITMIENSKKVAEGSLSADAVEYLVDYKEYAPYLRAFKAELEARHKRLQRATRKLVDSVFEPYKKKQRAELIASLISRAVLGGVAVNYILSWFGRDMIFIGDAIVGILLSQFAIPVALVGLILRAFGVF